MKKTLSRFWLKSALSVSLFLAGCVLVQFSQEKGEKEKKPAEPASSSQATPEKKATEEYEEVRSPFGIQRVPRRAGGSPFQQPTVPVAPAPAAATPAAAAPAQAPPQTTTQIPAQNAACRWGSAGRTAQLQQPKLLLLQRLILARASGLSA